MRTFYAILTFAVVTALAAPVSAVVVGPGTGPGESGVAPEYCPQDIPVYDMLAGTLGPVHKTKWYAGRNAAFAEWGLPFSIYEAEEVVPWTDENVNSGAVQQNVTQCAIFIIKDRRSTPGDQGGVLVMPAGGAVILNPWSGWWQSQSDISKVVAHEAGHALGFAHGTTGVMSGNIHVNSGERAVARTYYESLGFIF